MALFLFIHSHFSSWYARPSTFAHEMHHDDVDDDDDDGDDNECDYDSSTDTDYSQQFIPSAHSGGPNGE